MRASEETRERILEGTLRVFNEKGLKLTMDDLASELSMSKKTIYAVFGDKESLFEAMVDHCFDCIKESEAAVLREPGLGTLEKLRRVLGVMPNSYQNVDFTRLYLLKDKYPTIYRKVENRLESGWEKPVALLEQGIAEGVIRPIHPQLFKAMFEATLEQFFQRDVLLRSGITYTQALDEVVGILIDGIATTQRDME
jgi:AcrR family transcriptional regulator